MGERTSEYTRDTDDWYVEPEWCVEALKERHFFLKAIHDPCCGMGTIPTVFDGTGADIVDRGYGYPRRNFLEDDTIYDNIVTNPPYGIAQEVIEHAIAHTRYSVAALVQVKFLCSQKRYNLFKRDETEAIYFLSKRPSMPPGRLLVERGESVRGNGSIDFCWVVWSHWNNGAPLEVDWLK